MSEPVITPALTPEEWAEEFAAGTPLDERLRWACNEAGILDPMSIHALAALCLYQQPFGFTREDVEALRACLPVEPDAYEETMSPPKEILDRAWHVLKKLNALLPPDSPRTTT